MIRLDEVRRAAERLQGLVRCTPLLPAEAPGLWLKAESLQLTGSYKIRAALHLLLSLDEEQRRRGVALASSGNFAIALAWAGAHLGVPTALVMMQRSSPYKVDLARSYGADIIFCANRFEARLEALEKVGRERGMVVINHLEDERVLVGHATLGLEIAGQMPQTGTLAVPVSTGGLLAGVATVLKELRPEVRVVGVQPQGANATSQSFRARQMVVTEEAHTVCDALTATRPGKLPLEHILRYVDDFVEVSDDEVERAVARLAAREHLVVEPGGAVGMAAWMAGRLEGPEPVCLLLSGGNLAAGRLADILLRRGG